MICVVGSIYCVGEGGGCNGVRCSWQLLMGGGANKGHLLTLTSQLTMLRSLLAAPPPAHPAVRYPVRGAGAGAALACHAGEPPGWQAFQPRPLLVPLQALVGHAGAVARPCWARRVAAAEGTGLRRLLVKSGCGGTAQSQRCVIPISSPFDLEPCHQLCPPPPPAPQVRREARQRAYTKALGETMHSGEQAAIQSCLELLRQADSMEVRFVYLQVAAWTHWLLGMLIWVSRQQTAGAGWGETVGLQAGCCTPAAWLPGQCSRCTQLRPNTLQCDIHQAGAGRH